MKNKISTLYFRVLRSRRQDFYKVRVLQTIRNFGMMRFLSLNSMPKALMIIANEGFQDVEFGVPKKMLEESGIEVSIAAGRKGEAIGKFGLQVEVPYALDEVSSGNYDVTIFIGGPGAERQYHGNAEYFRLAREAELLAAICIAPTVLSESRIFQGKKVTGWDRDGIQKAIIEKNGGIFTGEDVTVDGDIITANGPEAATAFGGEILDALRK